MWNMIFNISLNTVSTQKYRKLLATSNCKIYRDINSLGMLYSYILYCFIFATGVLSERIKTKLPFVLTSYSTFSRVPVAEAC